MSFWGDVIETLTHDSEADRTVRRHRRNRREAARLRRSRSRRAGREVAP